MAANDQEYKNKPANHQLIRLRNLRLASASLGISAAILFLSLSLKGNLPVFCGGIFFTIGILNALNHFRGIEVDANSVSFPVGLLVWFPFISLHRYTIKKNDLIHLIFMGPVRDIYIVGCPTFDYDFRIALESKSQCRTLCSALERLKEGLTVYRKERLFID